MNDLWHIVNDYWLDDLTNENDFFHPNICHVCKRTNDGNLISCDQCFMISYCCETHKRTHHLEHQELCKCITQYLREKSGAEWRSLRSSTPEWIQSRYKFLYDIMQKFQCTLKLYETQMIILPKSCHICHQQINLHTCRTCYSDNYCVDHAQEFQNYHASKCRDLMLCLNLNIIKLSFKKFPRVFIVFPESQKRIDDMDSFIIRYVRKSCHRGLES